MKVSIIIPVYNVEPYIRRCLLSALNQTHLDLEIIVVDDCGQDASMEVVLDVIGNHPAGHKVHVARHEKNRGLSAARNTGINIATGEYVYFLDSDDEITPACIETLVGINAQYGGVEIVQGNTKIMPINLKEINWCDILYKNFPEHVNDNAWIFQHFYNVYKEHIPVISQNKLIKRQFIHDNNLFYMEGIIHEDEMWMFYTVQKLRSIAFANEHTYLWHTRPGSITQSGDNYKSLQNWLVILGIIFQDFNDPFHRFFKEKYTGYVYDKICLIDKNTREKELYPQYRTLVKNLMRKALKKFDLPFALAMYLLLAPDWVYKPTTGRKMYKGLLRASGLFFR